MAQCLQSVQEFIQDAFVPLVAVLCSEEAEKVTRKNELNFEELVRPFCRLTSEVHMRDPNNQIHVIKGLKISINNIVTQPPQPGAIRKRLNDVVSACQPADGLVANVITAGDYDLNISATTPWFEAYRENFFQTTSASDHEFLNHYLACMLVVSSREPEPIEQFLKLSQEQHRIQHSSDYSYPKWFIPNTLKYYVLLHDISEGNEQRVDSVYEEMKQRYGSQGCYLLKINSRTSVKGSEEQIPDPWSQYLHKHSLQNQDSYEDGINALIMNKNAENSFITSLDGLEHIVKDGVPNNFKSHPLQLDNVTDPVGHSDNPEPAKSTGSLQDVKKQNSVTAHGTCLTLNDHDRIRQFIQEFTFRGLVPHIEKTIRQLNDQLVSRKGLSRSLFTATKKWFSGNKVPEKGVNEVKNTAGLLLYALFTDQELVYILFAEMAAVSAFLQPGAPRSYPAHYMENAIQIYKDCRCMVLAERCTLLSAEILKSQGKYSDAAAILIRMTSEDSDLRSALLLEQAAHCFINMRNPMVRKFAFHMILAGHRFSKAGQRKHALRCYCQAMQVYKGKGWSLAEDHINFTIGRQSFTLRQLDNAVSAFKHILINDSKQPATQQGAFLREYLYVYKSVSQLSPEGPLLQLPLPCINSSATRVFFGHYRRLAEGEKQAATHVSLDQEYDAESSQQWKELEEQGVSVIYKGTLPPNFQTTQYCLNSQTDNSRYSLAVVEEPITVEVIFKNPLKVPLLLTDLSLLWKFMPLDYRDFPNEEKELISNEKDSHAKVPFGNEITGTEVIPEFVINGEEIKPARLKLFPHQTGELHILGVVYNLGTTTANISNAIDGTDPTAGTQAGKFMNNFLSVRGKQDLEIQGPRLNNTKEEKTSVRYGPDHRLDPIITEPMPLLEVFFINFPTGLLCGEIRKAYVEFMNVSKCPLTGLKVISQHPDFFTFGSSTASLTPQSPTASENCSAYKTVVTDSTSTCTALTSLVSPMDFGVDSENPPGVIDVPLPNSELLPGASVQLPLWLRGPDEEGVHEINFLFYYESTEKQSKMSHRVLRHTAVICTSRSLSVRATACRSNALEDEEGSASNMLVFLDVENTNTSEGVREFHIVQVSSGSKCWKLQKCISPLEDKDSKLTSRERAKLCFKASRCRNTETTSCLSEKYVFADLVLGNEQIISATTPCADFFFQNARMLKSKTSPLQANVQTSQTPGKQSVRDSLTLVQQCHEVELNIIVLWKAYVVEDNKQLILEGQLHVTLHSIGKEACSFLQKQESQEMVVLKFIRPEHPPVPPVPSLDQLSHLIKTSLHYPEYFSHPFQEKSLCLVPVDLVLSNCSQADVDVIIDLRHKSTSPEALEVLGSFTWLGKTQHKLQMKGQEVYRLHLKACFIHAGVYNLGTPRIFAKLSNQVTLYETKQNSVPALIIISNI
ncbi:trafficking protein particle complex subunit 8 [Protopterus annectens]|uniref:trafficking protein particle complex subunit 8 n=1 Tax=Protopterus annectens TaxID=7888 RepID=UPI001CF93326|nr:trafficking protein particle complex subunit 8 [Protopterus annectens]